MDSFGRRSGGTVNAAVELHDSEVVASARPTATRSSKFNYPVGLLSKKGGVTLKLDRGLTGLRVNGTSLVWDVPVGSKDRYASFQLGVSDADEKSIIHLGQVVMLDPCPNGKNLDHALGMVRVKGPLPTAIAPPKEVAMAVKLYLKLFGIPGDSTDADHKGWIEIEGFAFSMYSSRSAKPGESVSMRQQMPDISFTGFVGKQSSSLLHAEATGHHIPSAEVNQIIIVNNKPVSNIHFTLTDVIVNDYESGGLYFATGLAEQYKVDYARIQFLRGSAVQMVHESLHAAARASGKKK